MLSSPGHVFVVNGRLETLGWDAVVIPTDASFSVRGQWRPAAGLDRTEDWRALRPDGWSRGAAGPAARTTLRQADVWFVDVVAHSPHDAARAARRAVEGVARHASERLRANAHHAGRDLPLVAVPVLGTGGGGHGASRGALLHSLVTELGVAAETEGVDVAIVAVSRSDYSALQQVRRDVGVTSALPRDLVDRARQLAVPAARGDLALFLGAGVSMGAGLPSWGGLLTNLTAIPEVRATLDGIDPTALSALEQAELLQVVLDEHHDPRALGRHVAAIIQATDARPSLAHALLAGLRVREAVTTNYDRLYEDAVRASEPAPESGDPHDVLSVLPWGRVHGDRPWLLKMHGDVQYPETIVLSRSSFVGYDSRWKPVGAVLQSLMMTRHLLVVGASMTDENVLRFAYEVAGLREDLAPKVPAHRQAGVLGTVLSLEHAPAFERLWQGRFTVVPTAPDEDRRPLGTEATDEERSARRRRAARSLALFLDTLALHAEGEAEHLLDGRYAPARGGDQAIVVDRLRAAAADARRLAAHDPAWRAVADSLARFGAFEGPAEHGRR
ncbi:SIR2 family protein [Cellulosimicrobium sp. NPDC057862]|uniref:SIR2 family protein n=1 Tax=Cellulosimicrobium sp. NPDC057862 TaxID=3346266 RepID=UPI00366FD858